MVSELQDGGTCMPSLYAEWRICPSCLKRNRHGVWRKNCANPLSTFCDFILTFWHDWRFERSESIVVNHTDCASAMKRPRRPDLCFFFACREEIDNSLDRWIIYAIDPRIRIDLVLLTCAKKHLICGHCCRSQVVEGVKNAWRRPRGRG